MTWWLWVVAALLGAAVFGLGMLASWGLRRAPDVARTELLLGVFFTVVAVVVAADTIWLQVRLSQHITTQMSADAARLACNQRQNDALVAIARTRRDVDDTALAYDEALQVFLGAPLDQREPGDPVVTTLKTRLDVLVVARQRATQAYADHPIPVC